MFPGNGTSGADAQHGAHWPASRIWMQTARSNLADLRWIDHTAARLDMLAQEVRS
jgi:hypothetical protein